MSAQWAQVVKDIRALPGHENFLRPSSFTELQKAGSKGAVVLINISQRRSDAIIIYKECPVTVVPLPLATPEVVTKLADHFIHPEEMTDVDAMDVLRQVWKVIVRPVADILLDQLGVPARSRI